ncbi:hypothetical protein CAPTEDRAFT_150769 [Capitella teleta]|uniref:Uncharacterized protein n=1 Tax=Capitella teleta TaxID=283909 RepID=R7U8X1_CAPTE|nr:hypothetical protein CAPTEDRAFT_150769 [Capitella teleta]|eukprot:ELU02576.1 hypothetical protein CAPTEDRAFT_150769 [Capitella teleta]
MTSSLKGKVALITGASSGIGAGTALDFAALGAKLALVGRNAENLNKTAEKCMEAGVPKDSILQLVGDLTDDEFTKGVMAKTVEKFGQLDVLINNAGIVIPGTVETVGIAAYDEQMNINCRVYYHLTHLSVPHLKKTKGVIVNVSSVNGLRSFSGVNAYCVSKAGVDQLTRCSALDLAPYGIRVNAVNPGVILTEIHKRGGMDDEAYKKFIERCSFTHALGRPGEVKEVTQTIVHLASDASTYITGVSIPIDGGRHAMCPR